MTFLGNDPTAVNARAVDREKRRGAMEGRKGGKEREGGKKERRKGKEGKRPECRR